MNNEIDFAGDAKQEASGDLLKQISELATKYEYYQTAYTKLEKSLKEAKKRMTEIEAETLPTLMESAGMKEYKLTNGAEIKIQEILSASIPSITGIAKAKGEQREELIERREEGINWLRTHGGESLIKNEFIFSLGKGNDEKLETLKSVAEELTLPWANDENVHSGTLKAFLKEKIEKGDEIPFNTFGIYTGKIAKIKQPKN
jgi:hypothetical protein